MTILDAVFTSGRTYGIAATVLVAAGLFMWLVEKRSLREAVEHTTPQLVGVACLYGYVREHDPGFFLCAVIASTAGGRLVLVRATARYKQTEKYQRWLEKYKHVAAAARDAREEKR